MKSEIKKLYYSIGEVSKMVGLKAYVLRYWETEFKQLSPPKNRAGNRTYRQKDIDLIFKIKELLYNKKYTIEGARSLLSSKNNQNKYSGNINSEAISTLRKELEQIISIINEWFGAWRSPVAHCHGVAGVAGSNPVAPTLSIINITN